MPLQSRAAPVAECSQVDLGRHLPAIPAEVVDDVFVEEPRFPDGQQRIEIEIRPLALLLPGVEQRLSRFELAVIGADTRRVLATHCQLARTTHQAICDPALQHVVVIR